MMCSQSQSLPLVGEASCAEKAVGSCSLTQLKQNPQVQNICCKRRWLTSNEVDYEIIIERALLEDQR